MAAMVRSKSSGSSQPNILGAPRNYVASSRRQSACPELFLSDLVVKSMTLLLDA